MKCHCDQHFSGRIDRLCETHRRYFDGEQGLLRARLGRLEAENELLRGLVEIKHLLEGVKVLAPPVSVVKRVKKK